MTNAKPNLKPKRRHLTPEDYELMHYWVGIYNEELQRVIRVVNYMQENPKPLTPSALAQLELPFE